MNNANHNEPTRQARPGNGGTGSAETVLLDSLTIPGRSEHVRAVRGFVARTLGPGTDSTEAALLASELVANSMQHSDSGRDGGTVTVRLLAIPGGIRAEILDQGGATVPALRRPESGLAERGRGLQLLDALATRWDYARDAAGTLTWFELAVPEGQ